MIDNVPTKMADMRVAIMWATSKLVMDDPKDPVCHSGTVQFEIERKFGCENQYYDWAGRPYGQAWDRALTSLKEDGLIVFNEFYGYVPSWWKEPERDV